MAKELFMEKQQPVQVIADKDLLYVFICLNGKEKIVDSPDLGDSGNASPISYIEYDYNQFVVNRDSINLDDLMINPDKYLDYAANPELDNLKLEKIAQSKNALAGYLSSHPLFSDAKYMELERKIKKYRWDLNNFATQLSRDVRYGKDQFDIIFQEHEEYESLLREHNMTNGQTTIAMDIIRKYYKKLYFDGNNQN